ncbi:hypothetical protein [Oerskovia turbata]
MLAAERSASAYEAMSSRSAERAATTSGGTGAHEDWTPGPSVA